MEERFAYKDGGELKRENIRNYSDLKYIPQQDYRLRRSMRRIPRDGKRN